MSRRGMSARAAVVAGLLSTATLPSCAPDEHGSDSHFERTHARLVNQYGANYEIQSPELEKVLSSDCLISNTDALGSEQRQALREFQELFIARTGIDLGPHGADGTFHEVFSQRYREYRDLHGLAAYGPSSGHSKRIQPIDGSAIRALLENKPSEYEDFESALRNSHWAAALTEEQIDASLTHFRDAESGIRSYASTIVERLSETSEHQLTDEQCRALFLLSQELTHSGLYALIYGGFSQASYFGDGDDRIRLLESDGEFISAVSDAIAELSLDIPAEFELLRQGFVGSKLKAAIHKSHYRGGDEREARVTAEQRNALWGADWFQVASPEWQQCFERYLPESNLLPFIELAAVDEFSALEDPKRQYDLMRLELACMRDTSLFDRHSTVVGPLLQGRSGVEGALMDCRDSHGVSIVDRLLELSSMTMPLGSTTSTCGVTRQVIAEVCEPSEYIEQGGHGTCAAVTAVHYDVFLLDPAEGVRIAAGLLSESGEVELRSGDFLVRVPDSLERGPQESRAQHSRVLQAAVMDFANGPNEEYSNLLDTNYRGTMVLPSGLSTSESARVKSAILGEEYTAHALLFYSDEAKLEVLADLPLGTYVALNWDPVEASGDSATGVFGPRHAIYFLSYDEQDGRIYYRDPNGDVGAKDGESLENPIRLVESRKEGMYSMSEGEFLDRWRSYIVPASFETPGISRPWRVTFGAVSLGAVLFVLAAAARSGRETEEPKGEQGESS